MDIVVLSVRLLINCVRPRLLMISLMGASFRMSYGAVGRSPWVVFDFTRHLSFAADEPANATYAGFEYEKDHNYGKNIHNVPPLFGFSAQEDSRKRALRGGEGEKPRYCTDSFACSTT
jgi:hypothetical protein